MRTLGWAALVMLWHPCRVFSGDLVFSGSLLRVGRDSISIRLADRRMIDGRLPDTASLSAARLAAQYHLGDQVEIKCKPIQPVWEEDTERYQSLEVTSLRFLRDPSSEELSALPQFPAWRDGTNLLQPISVPAPKSPDPQGMIADHRLEHARDVNLDYAANMPNFVADETARRYTSSPQAAQWRSFDTIETEITFKGSRAGRDHIRRNGKPWDRPFQALPGFKWYGGFGTEIRPVFDLQCPTTITYEGRAELRGRQLLKYLFRSPADGCFGPFTIDYQRYNPARTGHVFLEEPGGNVVQLDEEAAAFPASFDFAQRNEEVSWDYVKIGDASHLLPVAANFVILYSSGNRFRVEVEYKNHRHFESATNITFH